ncbi:MAG: 4Fe-4S dicluster domain-containing protein [Actinomycetota bacterium]
MGSTFLLDLTQCIGCEGCVVACNTGNELPDGVQYIRISERVEGTFPNLSGGFDNHRCYHCSDAACVNVCPTGALFKEDDLTRVDSSLCSGCQYCVRACPYEVPVMANGVATKCDGCRDVTKAGGTPWCVQTCPSDALRFGPRDEIAAEAHRRASLMKDKYPNAQVYGESQTGGLGMLVVAPSDPESLDLPRDPEIPFIATAWQDIVKPGGFAITGFSIVAAGVAGVIARRNHMQEMRRLEEQGAGTTAAGTGGDGTTDAGDDHGEVNR